MGRYIPRGTLHGEIHSKVRDCPTPNGSDCRKAYAELCRREKRGQIDIEHDSFQRRVDFLNEVWGDSHCEATLAILNWQAEIVRKFNQRNEVSY